VKTDADKRGGPETTRQSSVAKYRSIAIFRLMVQHQSGEARRRAPIVGPAVVGYCVCIRTVDHTHGASAPEPAASSSSAAAATDACVNCSKRRHCTLLRSVFDEERCCCYSAAVCVNRIENEDETACSGFTMTNTISV